MTSPHPAKERLAFLDVARGLAALLILLEHGMEGCVPGYHALTFGVYTVCRAGLVLLFIISGFLIPMSLEQSGSNARFWLRRLFRLFPVYWLSIALAFACALAEVGAGAPLTRPGDWLLNLTMLQGFFNRPSVWGVFWTLQLELTIYVGFSVLYALRLLRHSVWIVAAAFVGYALLGLAQPFLTGKAFSVNGGRFLYFAPMIGVLARLYWQGRIRGRTLAALVAVHVLSLPPLWYVNHALAPEEVTIECLRDFAVTWGTAYGCFFLLLAASRWRMPAALCRPGVVSYSVYMLQLFVLKILMPTHWPAWVQLPCLAAGTLALSELTYRFVEAPGVALGRVVERRFLPPAPGKADKGAAPVRRAA